MSTAPHDPSQCATHSAAHHPKPTPDLHYLHTRERRWPLRVLMVCMGNICRSPTAHGVLQSLIKQADLQQRIEVDSAGTHAYHVGEAPDTRSQQHARQRGYALHGLRARQVKASDCLAFDVILVMDQANETAVRALAQSFGDSQVQHKIMRLASFATRHRSDEVPDPYYGGEKGFDQVLDLVEDACQSLLGQLRPYA